MFNYQTGIITRLIIIGSAITILLLIQLLVIAKRWACNEKDLYEPLPILRKLIDNLADDCDGWGASYFKTFVLLYCIGFLTALWGIGYPVLIIIGGLYGLKGFSRLKKKINKIREGK